jgi:hypothetical protein
MSAVISDIVQERLRQEQDQLLGRQAYERSTNSRRRNGFKRVRLAGLLRGLWVKKPVLRRGTPPSALLQSFRNFGHGLFGALAFRFWLRGTCRPRQCLNFATLVEEFSKCCVKS